MEPTVGNYTPTTETKAVLNFLLSMGCDLGGLALAIGVEERVKSIQDLPDVD